MKRLSNELVCSLAVAAIAWFATAGGALAADVTWDITPGDGAATTDGTGAWTDGAGNWNDGAGDVNWANATPDNAIIGSGGTAGTITLGGNVTVGTITFDAVTGSYDVTGGGNTLTLSQGVRRRLDRHVDGQQHRDRPGRQRLHMGRQRHDW